MKKLLIALLCLVLACCFAACNKDEEPAEEAASPTDLVNPVAEPVEGDPLVAEAEEEVSKLEQELDITIALPDSFQITRSVMVEGYMAQIEFTLDAENYTGRYALGKYENMSGFSKGFQHEETVDINGVPVKLRWTAKEDIMSEVETTIGVADAYDAEKDLSYMVVLTKDSTKEKLTDAMTAFMQAASLGAPEELVESGGAAETTDSGPAQD